MAQTIPSTDNLLIGKGIVIFKRNGSDTFFDMGNVSSLEITPTADTIDHFSSRTGIREKDLTAVTTKQASVKITMDEFVAENIAMMLMGDVDYTDPDSPVIQILSADSITGELRFYATNDVGPRWDIVLSKVTFLPSGTFSPISDEFGNMEMTGQAYSVNSSFGTTTLRSSAAAAPENIIAPSITGDGHTGDVMTAHEGTWLGDPTSYTYQWKSDGTNIVGATSKTFTLTGTQATHAVTCAVTAVNITGNSTATSNAITAAA